MQLNSGSDTVLVFLREADFTALPVDLRAHPLDFGSEVVKLHVCGSGDRSWWGMKSYPSLTVSPSGVCGPTRHPPT
jgi:hypothetical protein